MRVKRFYGKDTAAAMNAVKLAFGQDAVILETLEQPEAEPGCRVEILAAIDYDPSLKIVRENRGTAESVQFTRGDAAVMAAIASETDLRLSESGRMHDGLSEVPGVHSEYERLHREVALVKGMMGRLLVGSGLNEGWSQPCFAELQSQLLGRKVSAEIAHELMAETYAEIGGQLPPGKKEIFVTALVKAVLARQVMARVEVLHRSGMARVLALVGPTGVGKTTTLAKLAAVFKACGERVALISVDTYRLGAAEQILEYGRRLQVPVEIVQTRRELQSALNSFSGFDRILLDSMGRSIGDREGLAALYRLLQGLPGDTFMVLPAALQEEDLLENLVHFRAFNCRALLFTKLDETRCHGSILNALSYARLPLSFFTDGQQVPDDLEAASAERLADLLLDIV
ncbi:MAG: flagellar biosynthesis protein FlhF [Deltaproteobacteria bacterium]|nr:flagellar biosynthesis protein FlhF [Deltaproteobacteria bacterium]